MPKATYEMHEDSRQLADKMLEVAPGETLTFTQMKRLLGYDVREKRYVISRARRVAEREGPAFFSPVRSVGYQRLQSDELPQVGVHGLTRIRRQANTTGRSLRLGQHGLNDLSDAAQRQVLGQRAALGLIAEMTKPRNMPPVPENSFKPEPPAQTAAKVLKRMIGRKRGVDDDSSD